MLPQDEKYGGWAASGEIDILEVEGQEPTKVLGTLHFGSRWPANAQATKSYTLPDNGPAEFARLPFERVDVKVGEMRR